MKIVINATRNIALRLILFAVFCMVLISVIAYARGYRFNFNEGTITSTGIISVSSNPRPAKVYVNGTLNGATDTNLTLPYGKYTVEVKKEGYTDWKKSISLQGEIVMSLNALLFSNNPSLTPLTNIGISKAVAVGNSDKIILISDTGNLEKDGVYLFEPSGQPLTIFPPLKLLLLESLLPEILDISTATFHFDPNYRRAIVSFLPYTSEEETTLEEQPLQEMSYLIALDQQNIELFDITASKEDILAAWQIEKNREMVKIIETLHEDIQKVASESFYLVSMSPDEKKLMYVAKNDAVLPLVISPTLIGANQTPEERDLKRGTVYIYDKKEDKNFKVPLAVTIPDTKLLTIPTSAAQVTPEPTLQPLPQLLHEDLLVELRSKILWYPSSDYIAIKKDKHIELMQYDGENAQTVYAGPFEPDYFGISPDWNIMVISNLNPQNNEYGDLYSVGIR